MSSGPFLLTTSWPKSRFVIIECMFELSRYVSLLNNKYSSIVAEMRKNITAPDSIFEQDRKKKKKWKVKFSFPGSHGIFSQTLPTFLLYKRH